jgi:hypothetical protein
MVSLTRDEEKGLFEDQGGALKSLSSRIRVAYALGWIGDESC